MPAEVRKFRRDLLESVKQMRAHSASIARPLVAAVLSVAAVGALSADARERGFVRLGMAEGEVL